MFISAKAFRAPCPADESCLSANSEIFVLSGYSGAGKSTLCAKLDGMIINGKPVALIRSVTSRAPRSENENYTFVSAEEFEKLVRTNQLLEYNRNYNAAGYGTPLQDVLRAIREGKTPLLEIDRSGLQALLTEGKADPRRIKSAFLALPAQPLAQRLWLRGTESHEAMIRRLNTAVEETDWLDLYDAVIVNHHIDRAVHGVTTAFRGDAVASDFDTQAFRSEMREILSAWPAWVEKWQNQVNPDNTPERRHDYAR